MVPEYWKIRKFTMTDKKLCMDVQSDTLLTTIQVDGGLAKKQTTTRSVWGNMFSDSTVTLLQ